MALIGIDSILKEVLYHLSGSEKTTGIQILSYKRNRSVTILKTDNNLLQVKESGFLENVFQTDYKKLPKQLKTIFKREFPRSRKVRIVKLLNRDTERIDLKKI